MKVSDSGLAGPEEILTLSKNARETTFMIEVFWNQKVDNAAEGLARHFPVRMLGLLFPQII
jgi:hypothetical protein